MDLTQERLKSILCYDLETGVFTWRVDRQKGIGSIAGVLHKLGYWVISIDGVVHYAHRLAWLYETGDWPSCKLDHINLNRSDNRFENLREVTDSQSMMNRRGWSFDESKGATYNKESGLWKAQIWVNRTNHYLGSYETQEQAHAVYVKAARELHGEFCYTPLKE